MSISRHRRHWSIGVGQTGFTLFLTGVILLGIGIFKPPLDGVGTLVKETQPAAFVELREMAPGSVRLIEGRVGTANAVNEQGLAAYQRSHSVPDIRNEMVWSIEETVAPELLIEMDGGTVVIEPGYVLFGEMRQVTASSNRYDGVAPGDTVLAIGGVVNTGGELRMQASYLVYGSLEENQPARFDIYKIAGGFILAVLGAAIMGWLLSKGYRPFGDPKTGR